jgi:hypothetical protein
MKKIILFLGLIVLGLNAFSQDIRFTKGDVAPGKLVNGRDFEDFITGKIRITDASGAQYSFVKAEFTMKNKEGKNIVFTIKGLLFPQPQLQEMLDNGKDGATYTFNKIVVKDNTGKEITLPAAEFVYDPYNSN